MILHASIQLRFIVRVGVLNPKTVKLKWSCLFKKQKLETGKSRPMSLGRRVPARSHGGKTTGGSCPNAPGWKLNSCLTCRFTMHLFFLRKQFQLLNCRFFRLSCHLWLTVGVQRRLCHCRHCHPKHPMHPTSRIYTKKDRNRVFVAKIKRNFTRAWRCAKSTFMWRCHKNVCLDAHRPKHAYAPG